MGDVVGGGGMNRRSGSDGCVRRHSGRRRKMKVVSMRRMSDRIWLRMSGEIGWVNGKCMRNWSACWSRGGMGCSYDLVM